MFQEKRQFQQIFRGCVYRFSFVSVAGIWTCFRQPGFSKGPKEALPGATGEPAGGGGLWVRLRGEHPGGPGPRERERGTAGIAHRFIPHHCAYAEFFQNWQN